MVLLAFFRQQYISNRERLRFGEGRQTFGTSSRLKGRRPPISFGLCGSASVIARSENIHLMEWERDSNIRIWIKRHSNTLTLATTSGRPEHPMQHIHNHRIISLFVGVPCLTSPNFLLLLLWVFANLQLALHVGFLLNPIQILMDTTHQARKKLERVFLIVSPEIWVEFRKRTFEIPRLNRLHRAVTEQARD